MGRGGRFQVNVSRACTYLYLCPDAPVRQPNIEDM